MPSILETNMFVSATQTPHVWGSTQCEDPTRRPNTKTQREGFRIAVEYRLIWFSESGVDFWTSAYIPPEREPIKIGALRWCRPPSRDHFTLLIPTSRYPKILENQTQTLVDQKRTFQNPMPPYSSTPVGPAVGSTTVCVEIHLGHVDFMLFLSFLFQLGTKHKCIF